LPFQCGSDFGRQRVTVFYVRLNDFSGDILSNLKGFRQSPPLRYQTRQILAGCQITTFIQWLNLNGDENFSHHIVTIFNWLMTAQISNAFREYSIKACPDA
jgi:hypothetical protein